MLSDYKFARSAVLNLLSGENEDNKSFLDEKISQTIDQVFKIQPKWMESVNKDQLIKDIKQHLTIFIPGSISVFRAKDSKRHVEWFEEKIKNKKLKWNFWSRYQEFLLTQSKMAPTTVAAIDDQTNKILSNIEDPERIGSWKVKGVVVGSVQSGKTANYTGLINKALDAGYKRIIILTGQNNDLRAQTQERIEEGVIGRFLSNEEVSRKIGVGDMGYSVPYVHTATTRDENGDFSKRVAANFTVDPDQKCILMIKKHTSILEFILDWVRRVDCDNNFNKNIIWDWRPGMADKVGPKLESFAPIVHNKPLLIIDDECDSASVDTGVQAINNGTSDDEYSPKAINRHIRRILFAYEKSAYVGYTATPYSNIFIDPRRDTRKEGEDLFPQDFIINLPTPSNYIGPQQIFNDTNEDGESKYDANIKEISDHANWTIKNGEWFIDKRETRGWMPPRHTKDHIPMVDGKEVIVDSLKEAIISYMISCAIRQIRGYDNGNTMLVHVSVNVEVSRKVSNQIQNFLFDLKKIVIGNNDSFSEIKRVWKENYSEVLNDDNNIPNTEVNYSNIEKIIIEQLELNRFKPALMNGDAEDKKACDLIIQEQGNAIVIGGVRLSRGLTLKSLLVSYFCRTAQTALTDTMTQMGRWFGYKPGYEDLCRLYIPSFTQKHFREFAETEANLRSRIQDMGELGKTPNDYCMMIKQHPGFLITSRMKLRDTRVIRIDYNAYLGQSVVLFKKDENQHNIKAVENFIKPLGKSKVLKNGSHYLWEGISSEKIIKFLNAYKTHPNNTTFKSDLMALYVKNMNTDHNELGKWSVGIVSGKGKTGLIGNLSNIQVKYVLRNRDKKITKIDSNIHQFKVLTSVLDEALDFSELEIEVAKEESKKKNDPTSSMRQHYRWVRGLGYDKNFGNDKLIKSDGYQRGLLLIYPVVTSEEDTNPLIGIAISFPQSKKIGYGEYRISKVEYDKMQKNEEDIL